MNRFDTFLAQTFVALFFCVRSIKDLFIGEPNIQEIFYPCCFHLNELSKIRHAISMYECMNCVELHCM